MQFAVADSGALVFVPGAAAAPQRRLVWVDRSGEEELPSVPARQIFDLDLSPDGTQVAFSAVSDSAIASDVWISELARGSLTRLTTHEGRDAEPLWTKDGRRVAFVSSREGQSGVFWKAADGTGTTELIVPIDPTNPPEDLIPYDWSSDGTVLLVSADFPQTGTDIGRVSIDGDAVWEWIIQGPANEWSPTISSDGQWLAYTSNESGADEVCMQKYPELGGRRQIYVGGGQRPTWSADGRELIYLRPRLGAPLR